MAEWLKRRKRRLYEVSEAYLRMRTAQGSAEAPYLLALLHIEWSPFSEKSKAAIDYMKIAAKRGHRPAEEYLKGPTP